MVAKFGLVYSLHVLPLRLSALTEDTSMITVSSCGVKLQYILSGLERKAKTLDKQVHFCGFSFLYSYLQKVLCD